MTVLNPHPRYFPEAVASILRQTLEDFELIVVEDPSPSSCAEFLGRACDPRVRHIANPRRTSHVAQRNRGLAETRADLVAIMDADDVAAPDRLARQASFLRSHPDVAVAGSQIRLIDADGRPRGYRSFPLAHEEILDALPRVVPLNQPSVMFRKAAVLASGGYQPTEHGLAEDYELWSRLARRGCHFANLPEPLLDYRIHPGQLKATRLRDTIRAVLRVKELYWLDRMALNDRARMWGERCLLWLPEWVVWKLLLRTYYNDARPGRGPAGAGAIGALGARP